jgi:hypothetical protein
LRGTGIALEKRRRALRDYATRKYMRKAMKVLLAVDGSEAGLAAVEETAVEEIANRPWPPGSEVHAISVIHLPFTSSSQ